MGLLVVIVIAFLIVKHLASKKDSKQELYTQLIRKSSTSTVRQPNISVSFSTERPKPKTDYKYPWDETRPSDNTDFSNANFLYYFEKVRSMNNDPNQFGRSVSYKLHIYDPIKRRNDLLSKGFLRLATPEEILNTYKVVELKEILRENSLSMSGKKADLVSRIASSIDLNKLNLPSMCCISDKGKDFIEQNQDLIRLASNPYNITYAEYIYVKNSSPSYLKYNDIIWAVFNKREMAPDTRHSTYIMNAYHRADFLRKENKLAGSLQQYIYALYYEMNDPIRVIPDSIKEYYEDEERKPMQIHPEVIETVYELKDYFLPIMLEKCFEIHVPKVLITRRNFETLLNDIFAGNNIDVRNYLPKEFW